MRSFVYLDERKLYSYSSQIFEGLTEYIINTRGKGRQQDESGPLSPTSKQVLADIFTEQVATEERKFLYDHAYKLVEDKLLSDGGVLDISRDTIPDADLNQHDFVRVRGTVTFNDVKMLKNVTQEFNALGEALAYVTNFQGIAQAREEAAQRVDAIKDRNKRHAFRDQVSNALNPTALAKNAGLHFDKLFLDSLAKLLEFGFGDQFEVRISFTVDDFSPSCPTIFSAILKREYLRESEDLLIRKYARKSQREFTLFGVIAQSATPSKLIAPSEANSSSSEPSNIKAAILTMVDTLVGMDNTMSGRLPNEVVIDPIALYLDVRAGTPK